MTKLFVARISLSSGERLHPLTVIAVDKKHALTSFLQYLKDRDFKEKDILVDECPNQDFLHYGYDPKDPVSHVVEHENISWSPN